MGAFIDVRCKCGKKIGWFGKLTDRPKCPKCGHRPPQAELEKAERESDAAEAEILRSMASAGPRSLWKQRRLDSSHTLMSACEALGLKSVAELSAMERGVKPIPSDLLRKMYTVYKVSDAEREAEEEADEDLTPAS